MNSILILDKGTGLLPLPANPGKSKDFSKTVVFGASKPNDIPTVDFVVATPLKIKDQRNTDFCSGFATSEVSEDQEELELDPLFQFAQIKRIIGDFKGWGADLRSAGMALVTHGSLPQKFAPFTIESHERDFLADWTNYPVDLSNIALGYKKKSMFFVDGPFDDFDNIRVTLWENREKKQSVIAGVMWRNSWSKAEGGIIPPSGWEDERGGGHCVKIFGQKKINSRYYLMVQNSWGESAGDKGIYYFPREAINHEFAPYGQIFFSDMSIGDAKYYNENGISIHDHWAVGIWKGLKNFIIAIFTTIFKK